MTELKQAVRDHIVSLRRQIDAAEEFQASLNGQAEPTTAGDEMAAEHWSTKADLRAAFGGKARRAHYLATKTGRTLDSVLLELRSEKKTYRLGKRQYWRVK